MIKGFIFDMDGVITETANLHFRAWRDEVHKLGILFTEEENATLKGLPRYDTLRAILKMHNRLKDFSESDIKKIGDNKNIEYIKMLDSELSRENILPGVEEFLKKSKENGIKMAIASSSMNAPKILEKTGLIKYFDHVVNPSTVKNGKPAPDIYLMAIKSINLEVDDVIGFEDAMPGVIGLKSGNIKTVAITWGDDGDWKVADHIVESTIDLKFDDIIRLGSK